jgi:2-polyprenyl-3-methyl-5-hydroxy-6-metoxy-1,4-benzoquinol methylase
MDANYFAYTRGEMMKYVPMTAKNVLEVGCSTGLFGKTLRSNREGIMVVGVEPHAESAAEARKNIQACHEGLFDAKMVELLQSQYPEPFDAIVFNDVLEHLLEPDQALLLCRQLLSPQGVIVASIPNILYFHAFFKMFLSKDWKYEDGGIFDRTHFRFFTKKSVLRLFEEAKYDISQIEGIHPTDSKKMTLFNIFTFGKWSEMRYMQWAVQAKMRP